MTEVIIPNSVNKIESGVFKNCPSLISVNISDNVTSIGKEAFYKCSSLKSISIPNKVKWIHEYAFYHCSALAEVTIGSSVSDIDEYAFYTSGIVTLYVYCMTPPDLWNDKVFTAPDYENTNLYVPLGTKELYLKDNYWRKFKNISEFYVTDIKSTVDENAIEVARYTINGKRICAPQKGVNIIKMSDGTTKKVLVK